LLGLDHLANLAEIFAAVLVIVSLVYVGVQIKQNTSALRSNTAHNTSEGFTDLYLILAQVQFFAYFQKFFRTYENAYYQYTRSALEVEPFDGLTKQLEMVSSLSGVKQYWRERKNWYNQDFQNFVDNMFDENENEKFTLAHANKVKVTSAI